jgi:general stress protein 26
MEKKESQELCKMLLETAWPVYLTTVDVKGYPQTRAMFNLRNKKWFPKLVPFFEKGHDFTIIFSTNTSSAKINDIKINTAASVYYCNPEAWKGVMFGGDIEIIDDVAIKKALWHDDWERYYSKGFNDPDHTVLRINPTIAKGWTGSTTFRLEIGDYA